VAPGQKECDQAIEAISSRLRELDEVAMLAVSQGQIPHYNSASLQMSAEKTEQAANEILTRLEPLRQAAKYQAESIAFSVSSFLFRFLIALRFLFFIFFAFSRVQTGSAFFVRLSITPGVIALG
jgi:hypothetical protein